MAEHLPAVESFIDELKISSSLHHIRKGIMRQNASTVIQSLRGAVHWEWFDQLGFLFVFFFSTLCRLIFLLWSKLNSYDVRYSEIGIGMRHFSPFHTCIITLNIFRAHLEELRKGELRCRIVFCSPELYLPPATPLLSSRVKLEWHGGWGGDVVLFSSYLLQHRHVAGHRNGTKT